MRLLLLIALVSGCSRSGFHAEPGDDAQTAGDQDVGWWSSSWSRRVPLAFDNTASQEDLLGFPVLLRLDSSRLDFSATAADGADLRFIDSGNGLELAYEIEQWALGNALVWVRVPSIPAGVVSPTPVFMYYGGPPAPGEDGTAVWAGDYRRVYHFAGTLFDSANAAVNAIGGEPGIGFVGTGVSFAMDDWLNLGTDMDIMRNLPAVTLTAWARPLSFNSDEPHLIACSITGAPNRSSRAALVTSSVGQLGVYGRAPDSGGLQTLFAAEELVTDQWSFVAAVLDYQNDTMSLFVDGAQVAQTNPGFVQGATDDTNSASCAIGAEDDGSQDHWSGSIDEARIIAGRRSADWLAAENRNLRDDGFVIYANEEVRP